MSAKAKAVAGFALLAACLAIVIGTLLCFFVQERAATAVAPVPADGGRRPTVGARDGTPDGDIDWGYLGDVNPDVIGWLAVPGTNIDLLLVQAPVEDPGYYLAHDFSRNANAYGCPYLASDCADEGLASRNCVVYGHNMGWGDALFADFARYSDETFAENHRAVLLFAPGQPLRRLAVVAVCVIDGNAPLERTRFEDANDFARYCAELEEAACVSLEKIAPGRQLFTFCTCSYTANPANERTLVLAQESEAAPHA